MIVVLKQENGECQLGEPLLRAVFRLQDRLDDIGIGGPKRHRFSFGFLGRRRKYPRLTIG
jgi:hypothetical protein